MTFDMVLTLGILGVAIVLFVSERLRADLVGLLVLVTLVVVGLVTPDEGIAGFANPAVVTVWGVFILSAGLARTGVASRLGDQVLRLARLPRQEPAAEPGAAGERRLLAVLMSSTAALSAFMNNIGVAAMFLPVTVEIARRTGRPASRLLLPMAYGSLLGGMLMLIGTSSNLVVSDFLRDAGMRPLGLFDFTPVGVVILVVAVGYTLLLGRRTLPVREPLAPGSADASAPTDDRRALYGLEERLATLVVPEDSPLLGRTLAESRLGQALGLNVLSVERLEGRRRSPDPGLILEAGDRLRVLGRTEVLGELAAHPVLRVEDRLATASQLISERLGLAELDLPAGATLVGQTVVEAEVRRTLGVNVLAVCREGRTRRTNLHDLVFQAGDRLLVQGPVERLQALTGELGARRLTVAEADRYRVEERLLFVSLPEGSSLSGRTLAEVRLAAAYGISVLAVVRQGDEWVMPEPSTRLEDGDVLMVQGRSEDLEVLRGHQSLAVEGAADLDLGQLENGPLAIVEVMLSPYTPLVGKTLRRIRFRERYGLTVLAVWRGGRPRRSGLGDLPLRAGDALLCHGPREKFELLARERDFVVLRLDVQEQPRTEKAPVSGLIMAGVVAAVLTGWLPISVAAIAGAALMVLGHCLTMEEAYRSVEWRAVFLIATMLPLGLAMQRTGAAALLAEHVVTAAGPYGPTAILAGIMTLTLIVNQFIPSAVNAVVMTPIALATAAGLGVSPYPFVMAVAYAAAASFMTPVSHPANVLVMVPGGYRFRDYLKNGLALSVIVLVVSIALLPVVFPF